MRDQRAPLSPGLRFAVAWIRCVLAVIAGGLATGPAAGYDAVFRCGSKLVYTGMTQADVFEYCGEPASKSTELREVRSNKNQVLGTTEITRWIYASFSATRVLVFVDDKLQSVQRL